MIDTFWVIWRDFDRNEKGILAYYDQVIFVFGGQTYKFKGSSGSMIMMRAMDMIRFARENGSDAIVAKYVTSDTKKLKYVIY